MFFKPTASDLMDEQIFFEKNSKIEPLTSRDALERLPNVTRVYAKVHHYLGYKQCGSRVYKKGFFGDTLASVSYERDKTPYKLPEGNSPSKH